MVRCFHNDSTVQGLFLSFSGEALGTDTNHDPLLFHPPHHLPLLGAPRVGIDPQDGRDPGLVLALLAVDVPLVGAADGRDGRVRRVAVAGRRRHGACPPGLLQGDGVRPVAVVGRHRRPEAVAVRAVHGLQPAHVDGLGSAGRRRGRGEPRAVQAERRHGRGGRGAGHGGRRGGPGVRGGREARGRQQWRAVLLRVLLQRVVPGGAQGQRHAGGLGQDGGQPRGRAGVDASVHDAGELHAAGGARVAVADDGPGGRHAAAGGLMDGARDRGLHEGGVSVGRRARRHGRRPLAAVAAVAQLVVVQAACQLRLLQMGGDVLVRHLLQAGLKKVYFLLWPNLVSKMVLIVQQTHMYAAPPTPPNASSLDKQTQRQTREKACL